MTERAILLNLPKSRPINISFENLTYSVSPGTRKEKKQIIKGIGGEFRSGELTAIMGPSGAGKSTLLNLLTGYQTTGMGGCVYANGTPRRPDGSDFKKENCYIMQDDYLHPVFTVLETMSMATDLKLGSSISEKAKLMVIEDILQTLGLSTCKYTKCQRLSGGQRKRLSIALELIDNPPVMFLDEPTTGLDSSSTFQCIKVLKALAKGGRTVVCTIHQPSASIFEMFDHVYVLTEGHCIYQGSSTNTVPYLKSVGLLCPQYHNPADFIAEVANGDYGNYCQELASAAQDSRWRSVTVKREELVIESTKDDRTAILISQPSEFTRLYVLMYRNVLRMHRDWTITHLKIVLHIFVAVILGLIFEGCGNDGSKTFNNVLFAFCSVIYMSYTSLMPAVLTFPTEIKILKKETFNNWYKLWTYFLAFLLTNTPVQILLCLAYAGPSYYLSSQPLDITRFAMFLTMCVLVSLSAEGVGLYLGTLDNVLNALFFGSIFTAFLLVFSGCLCLFSAMPTYLYIISYFCFSRYAFEGLVLSMYGYGRPALPCPEDVIYCHLKFPDKIMQEMGVMDGRYWVDILALVGMLLFFRTLAFVALMRKLCFGKM